jgi:hypothetical protein
MPTGDQVITEAALAVGDAVEVGVGVYKHQ